MWFISSPHLQHGYVNLLAASVYTGKKTWPLKDWFRAAIFFLIASVLLFHLFSWWSLEYIKPGLWLFKMSVIISWHQCWLEGPRWKAVTRHSTNTKAFTPLLEPQLLQHEGTRPSTPPRTKQDSKTSLLQMFQHLSHLFYFQGFFSPKQNGSDLRL